MLSAVCRQSVLAGLREQIERIQTRRRGEIRRCPSGLEALDAALGGGFLLGGVHELLAGGVGAPTRTIALMTAAQALGTSPQALGPQTFGPQTFGPQALGPQTLGTSGQALTSAQARGAAPIQKRWLIYVDTLGNFYPPAADRLDVPLDQLLIVRTGAALDALWVCEQALRCPATAAVIVALSRGLDAHASRRLQLAAESGGGLAFLLLDEQEGGRRRNEGDFATGTRHAAGAARFGSSGGSFAASRLRVTALTVPAAESETDSYFPVLTARVEVLKLREGGVTAGERQAIVTFRESCSRPPQREIDSEVVRA